MDITQHIRDLLPGKKDNIDKLAMEDEEFRALSDDFDACIDALHHWADSDEPESEARVEEYIRLVEGLYKEIIQVLGNNDMKNQK